MLPKEFAERMKALLGKESEKFFAEIENNPAQRSFRINETKLTAEAFEKINPEIKRKKADFPPNAYYTDELLLGFSPAHHAGMIYVQDPSAMATVHALEIKKGWKILDSCSAPGGKTTQLSAAAGKEGIVVANEYDAKRSRILYGNVERMGDKNTVVLNLDTAVLAETYREVFDLVLADAPCSGEGMFRKNSRAIDEWSIENVKMCAHRQREILNNVSECVAKGGYLLYSTCTFSLEENEMNVDWFLREHSEFELCQVSDGVLKVTSDGINFDGCQNDMAFTRRYYPHISRGEGQFIALMRKTEAIFEKNNDRKKKKDDKNAKKPTKEQIAALEIAKNFLKENLLEMPKNELFVLGNYIYLKPDVELPSFGVVSVGACVGEIQKNRLIPHHQLFSAYGKHFRRQLCLPCKSKELQDYLLGLEISADGLLLNDCDTDGYCAVTVEGVALGGGKVSQNKCKNHYPRGLRNTK